MAESVASVRFYVIGLSCGGGGALTLERVLARTKGVLEVVVNPAAQIAHVLFDPRKCGPTSLVDAASKAGFSVVPLRHQSEPGRPATSRTPTPAERTDQ